MNEERQACPQCGGMIVAGAVICRFCKADFRQPARRKGLSVIVIIAIVAAVLVPIVAILAAIVIPFSIAVKSSVLERNALLGLERICKAEGDFRNRDRDRNGVKDYWTGDVAGLHRLRPGEDASPIRCIPLSLAAADAAPVRDLSEDQAAPLPPSMGPTGGYVYRAMTQDASGNPYAQDTKGPYRNRSRFAFCAVPAEYPSTGRNTYIVSEGRVVYRKDTGGEPVMQWPSSPEREGWQRAQGGG